MLRAALISDYLPTVFSTGSLRPRPYLHISFSSGTKFVRLCISYGRLREPEFPIQPAAGKKLFARRHNAISLYNNYPLMKILSLEKFRNI